MAGSHEREHSIGQSGSGVNTPSKSPATMASLMPELLRRLESVSFSGNVDHDFTSLMLEHHRTTLLMAEMELARGHDPRLLGLADTLRQERAHQSRALARIADRLHDLPANYQAGNAEDEVTREWKAVVDTAASHLGEAPSNVDTAFVSLLRVHLQIGLDLAHIEVAHGSDKDLVAFAHQLIHDQRKHLVQTQLRSKSQP